MRLEGWFNSTNSVLCKTVQYIFSNILAVQLEYKHDNTVL